MSQHTPGPWRAVTGPPKDQPQLLYRSLICVIEQSGDRYWAVVQDDGKTVRAEQWEPIARLIAAAPELLKAAQAALPYIDAYGAMTPMDEGHGCGDRLAADALRAAIAKATGEKS